MRKYKFLSEEEVSYFRSLTGEEIKSIYQKMSKDKYLKVNMYDIELDRPFYVCNGDWEAFLSEELGNVYLYILELNTLQEQRLSRRYLGNLEEFNKHKESNLVKDLEAYYLDEDAKLQEIGQIVTDKTTYLYSADVNCDHEIVGGDNYSGIKCAHCRGWYCA